MILHRDKIQTAQKKSSQLMLKTEATMFAPVIHHRKNGHGILHFGHVQILHVELNHLALILISPHLPESILRRVWARADECWRSSRVDGVHLSDNAWVSDVCDAVAGAIVVQFHYDI